MADDKKPCPICKLAAQDVEWVSDYGERITINCARCHRFTITRTAEAIAENKDLGPKMSAWIRNRNEQGANVPEINSYSLDNIAEGIPEYSPREKQTILLQNMERRSQYPGYAVHVVPEFDVPLAWATAKEEFLYYLDSLIERGLLRRTDEKTHVHNDISLLVTITAAGWDYLEKYSQQIEERSQVFIAMSFSDDMRPIWENAIKPAIKRAGYKPYKVDVEPHIDRIDVKIIAEINNSRFVVADVTHQKHGVYFEAGYALGIGLPVIWCVRKEDLKNVHFDTRQYNHIVWENEENLKEQLYNFICAVIGKGREASQHNQPAK
jgi:hypothetical protein